MNQSIPFVGTKRASTGLAALLLAGVASWVLCSPAAALTIDPTYGAGTNATVDGAINTAISTLDGLYSNAVTIPVTFTYTPATTTSGCKTCILEDTNQTVVKEAYATYVSQLTADSAANPQNTVLPIALAHLGSGNNASGSAPMVITGNQLYMLSGNNADIGATININANITNFAFSRPVASTQFDAIGGLEHELDEVLGGGGGGSTLNGIEQGIAFFEGAFGATDLYRYSAPGTPSHTTSAGASSYYSIDGGVTQLVGFNQDFHGDYGDYAPNCGNGAGQNGSNPAGNQYIQNAFNCTGSDEAYTTLSPEYIMEESIGWNPTAGGAVPEPASLALFGSAVAGLAAIRRRRRAG
jgi:hypothetical protein